MKIPAILIIVLVWSLTACTGLPKTALQTTSESPAANVTKTQSPLLTSITLSSQTSSETITPTQTASEWCTHLLANYLPENGFQTYCDKDYGFAFDYPEGWKIFFVAGSPPSTNPIEVLKAQRFGDENMSNYIRVDTFLNFKYLSLLDQVHNWSGYSDREFPNNDYPSLTLGGQKAYAIMNCWQQDYSAVDLFFLNGEYHTILELKAISREGLNMNWQIARSLQTPGSSPDKNVIPQELIDDSYKLLTCNAAPTTTHTPLTPILPTWTVTPVGASNLEIARHTLLTFFTLLHDRRYAEAVPLYGGSYDGMRNNNSPVIPPDDYAALFESSCTNQRPCLLVANIVDEEVVSQDEYKFMVEFVWIDGTLYKRGPCCGATETEMPPEWQFPYTVKIIDGQFKVMEEPVIMP